MRAVIQRVDRAKCIIDNIEHAKIKNGLLIYIGFTHEDTEEDIQWLVRKIPSLRIFPDENGLMNNDLRSVGGEVLVISQFTLHARTKKGKRPSFIDAAKPEQSIPQYEQFISSLKKEDLNVQSGVFGAHMMIDAINNGPVTLVIDTKSKE